MGEPRIYFLDNLRSEWQGADKYHRESRVLWEIDHYMWRRPNKGTTVNPDDADEYSADGAHAMAAFRYLIMARLGPSHQEKEDEPRGELSEFAQELWDDVIETERQLLEEQGHV